MRLDPIVIVPYDPDWIASFACQRAVVETALGAALSSVPSITSEAPPYPVCRPNQSSTCWQSPQMWMSSH